jgi:hypothetical protein
VDAKKVEELKFVKCVLASTWGKGGDYNGGFLIQYDIKDFGFGEVTFAIRKDGTLECDLETCGREFAARVLQEMMLRATVIGKKRPRATDKRATDKQ